MKTSIRNDLERTFTDVADEANGTKVFAAVWLDEDEKVSIELQGDDLQIAQLVRVMLDCTPANIVALASALTYDEEV